MAFTSGPAWISVLVIFWPALAVTEDVQLQFLPDGQDERFVYVNDNYFVQCFAPENVNAVRITWRSGPKEIKERTGRIHVEETSNKPGMDLFFEGITVRDQGEYQCSATIDGNEVTKSFILRVYKKISFDNTPDIQYITEGENQVVHCEVTALPEAMIAWKINGKTPIFSKHVQLADGLMIRNVSRDDSGIYACRATQSNNHISDFEEKNINVIVKYKPEWKNSLKDTVYSYLNGVINITCEADGQPTPDYTWFQNEAKIESKDDLRIFHERGRSALQIHVQNESDFGEYSCLANNSEGTIEKIFELVIGAKPDIPSFVVKKFDTNSIVLDIAGTSSEELKIMGYTIQYRAVGQSWTEGKQKDCNLADETDELGTLCVLENLTPSMSYYLRVAARNVVGLSDFSKEFVQMTGKEVVPVAEFDTSSTTSSSSTLAGLLRIIILTMFAPLAGLLAL